MGDEARPMSDATTTLHDSLAPRPDHVTSALPGSVRGLTAVPVRLARFLGFWTAVTVPFTYLPLLAFDLPGASAETFVGLVAANCVGLVLGRNYGRDPVADASSARPHDAETGRDAAGDLDAVDPGTDAVDAEPAEDARIAADAVAVDAEVPRSRASDPEAEHTGPGTPASPSDHSPEAPATGAAD
jgi:hypothetical protein